MGRVGGKVAVVTGAARGMGRAHAVKLAEEGADIIAIDLPEGTDIAASHDVGTPAELAQTGTMVRDLGRRAVTAEADVRDHAALKAAIERR
jgi:(+)-trans-carveol dehydrogenase